MKLLASEAKAARSALVLDAAAVEFNRAGVAGANLAAIAAMVGLSRAALYNYCADREDLALRAYLRACELTAQDLERATYGSNTGAGRLNSFLRMALALDHPPVAVLADLSSLSQASEAQVRAARASNVAALVEILRSGVADGSLRSCNLELACQTIWGVLSWASIAQTWAGEAQVGFTIRMAAAIPDLLLNGIAAGAPPTNSDLRIRLTELVPAIGDFAKDTDNLLAIASLRFNQRGIDGVALEDLSAEVGATKGLVYHRFKSKKNLVAACFERAFAIYSTIMTVANAAPTGVERTRLNVELNIQAQLSSSPPLSLSVGFKHLSKADRERFVSLTRDLRARAAQSGHDGVRDGSMRPYDVEAVQLVGAGVYNYLAKWSDQSDLEPPDISREVSDTILYGLQRRGA
jgi:AcrR family transcriptional regulator